MINSDRVRIFISSANSEDCERMDLSHLDSQSKKTYLAVLMKGHEENFHRYNKEEVEGVILDISDQCEVEEFNEQKKRLINFFKKVISNSNPMKIRIVFNGLPLFYANDLFPIILALNVLEEMNDCNKFSREKINPSQFIDNCTSLSEESDVVKKVVRKILRI